MFDYHEAISRNIGWVTEYEQQVLRGKTVAVAGLGGVGGIHVLTCARLGIQNFRISDLDEFEVANFNRQVGATCSSVGKKKADVLRNMILDINPEASVEVFSKGIHPENIDQFLDEADIYIDGMDLFCMKTRRMIFSKCYEKNIPAITHGPMAMGTAYMTIMPGGESFEDFCDFKRYPEEDHPLVFLVALAPHALHRQYLMDASRVDLKKKTGPSTIMGCLLSAGTAVTEALKILLNRGKVYSIPYSCQFDAYKNQYKTSYTPFGNKNPLQRLKIFLAKKSLDQIHSPDDAPYVEKTPTNILEKIIDIARWAPSGHNQQNWSVNQLKANELEVNFSFLTLESTQDEILRNSLTVAGMFLENVDLAASLYAMKTEVLFERETPDGFVFNVTFKEDKNRMPDPLAHFIRARFVDRRPYKKRALKELDKKTLEMSLSHDYGVQWNDTLSARLSVGTLDASVLKFEVLHPYFYEETKHAIDMSPASFNKVRIPVKSLNLSFFSRKMMGYLIKDERKFHFVNKYLGGYIAPMIEFSLIPYVFSSSAFTLFHEKPLKKNRTQMEKINDSIQGGRQVQKFWLTATMQGISLQPGMLQSIFARTASDDFYYKEHPKFKSPLEKIRSKFIKINGMEPENVIFTGRVGYPTSSLIYSRSLRKPVNLNRK